MIWLTWRQHRGELLGALVVLGGFGLLLLLHGVPMYQAYDRGAIAACHELILTTSETPGCLDEVIAFDKKYGALPEQFTNWLPLTPALVGMLVGAPLLAREYEQRTWQLVWTQGVTRTRWLAIRLTAVLVGAVVVSAAFAAGLSWWIRPSNPAGFDSDVFNHTVLILPAYVLLAVAIGILAGVVFRRTLLAAALVVPGYLAVRLPVEFWLRPRYREPVMTEDALATVQGWIVRGEPMVTGDAEMQGGPVAAASIRLLEPVGYHPADRFWEFQLIETGILLGITAVLLLVAWQLVLGRRTRRTTRESREPALSAAGA